MAHLEINEQIAKILGLNYARAVRFCPNREEFLVYDDGSMEEIDFTADWSLCGPLLEKLLENIWSIRSRNELIYMRKEVPIRLTPEVIFPEPIKRSTAMLAICEAFIEDNYISKH